MIRVIVSPSVSQQGMLPFAGFYSQNEPDFVS